MIGQQEHETVFVVKIRSTGEADQIATDRLAHFMAVYLHRGFGIDRVGIWHEGRRFIFDPENDAEHFGANVPGKWMEIVQSPAHTNGNTP